MISLAGRVRAAADGDECVRTRVSSALRPALLAALLEDYRALEGRPALIVTPDDRSARDLALSLRAYLGDRRVRSYPSRGTGYASQVTPPPHLIGLRIDALDSFGRDERTPAVVVASAIDAASIRAARHTLVYSAQFAAGRRALVVTHGESPAAYATHRRALEALAADADAPLFVVSLSDAALRRQFATSLVTLIRRACGCEHLITPLFFDTAI